MEGREKLRCWYIVRLNAEKDEFSRALRAKRPLSAGDTRHSGVGLNRHSQGASRTLEDRFTNVVAVSTVVQHDVQVCQGVGRRGLPEVLDQLAVKFADLLRRKIRIEDQEVTSAQVDRGCD